MSHPPERGRLVALQEIGRLWWFRVGFASVILLTICTMVGFRVNVTRSLPLGLYRTVGGASAVERGDIVIVCLPPEWARFALQRGILGPGHCEGGSYGLGKIVLAVGGDVVEFHRDGLTVNGKAVPESRPMLHDRHLRDMPHHPWGRHILRAREIWLFSPYHPAAFDSRYFGPLARSRVQSVVRPLWTAKSIVYATLLPLITELLGLPPRKCSTAAEVDAVVSWLEIAVFRCIIGIKPLQLGATWPLRLRQFTSLCRWAGLQNGRCCLASHPQSCWPPSASPMS